MDNSNLPKNPSFWENFIQKVKKLFRTKEQNEAIDIIKAATETSNNILEEANIKRDRIIYSANREADEIIAKAKIREQEIIKILETRIKQLEARMKRLEARTAQLEREDFEARFLAHADSPSQIEQLEAENNPNAEYPFPGEDFEERFFAHADPPAQPAPLNTTAPKTRNISIMKSNNNPPTKPTNPNAKFIFNGPPPHADEPADDDDAR